MENIGERIKFAREARGLTQKRLSHLMGYDYTSTIASWETGRRNPSPIYLAKLASILHVNILWLKTGTGEMSDPNSPETPKYIEEAFEAAGFETAADFISLKEIYYAKDGKFGFLDIAGENCKHLFPKNFFPDNYKKETIEEQFSVYLLQDNSMQPTLKKGDKLIVQLVSDFRSQIAKEDIIVAVANEDVVVRKVREVKSDGLLLVSENPKYKDLDIEPTKNGLGKVEHALRTFK